MRRTSRVLVSVWACLCVQPSALAQEISEPPQLEALEGAEAYVYRSTPQGELRLHVFGSVESSAGTSRPAIVFFFGGGFVRGMVDQFANHARHLAGRGMVGIVADYRVSGRHGTGRLEAFTDGLAAIRWVRANAGELGIDADRIAVGGGSSGGAIALVAAVLDGLPISSDYSDVSYKPNALVLFAPGGVTDDSGRLTPANNLRAGLPAAVIYHGTEDDTIPYEDAERFCEEYRAYGNSCQFVGIEGAGHMAANSPSSYIGPHYRETLLDVDRYLTEMGYLPSPAADELVSQPAP